MEIPENRVAREIVDAAFKIHVELGPGMLESVYEVVLIYELEKRGLSVENQVSLPVVYDGKEFDVEFRADLIVEDLVVVELKATENRHPVHVRQLTTYVKLTGKRLGLLLNFGTFRIKDGIVRIANRMPT